MKNSFSVMLFLVGLSLVSTDCEVLGLSPNTQMLVKDIKNLQKNVDSIRGELKALQSQPIVNTKESDTTITLFDIYARIDVAVNCFNIGGKEVIRKSLEDVKGLKSDSIDILYHRLYATGVLSAFEKFSEKSVLLTSSNIEYVLDSLRKKTIDVTVSDFIDNKEHLLTVSFGSLLSGIHKYSDTNVSIGELKDLEYDELMLDGVNIKECEDDGKEYHMPVLGLESLGDIVDKITLDDGDVEKLLLTESEDDDSSSSDNESGQE